MERSEIYKRAVEFVQERDHSMRIEMYQSEREEAISVLNDFLMFIGIDLNLNGHAPNCNG